MKKLLVHKLLTGLMIGCLATSAVAQSMPVQLHIDAANSNGGLVLLSESGWPLTIKMVIDLPEDEEFPGYAVQPNFPTSRDVGFLIFNDPDGCLNPPVPGWQVAPTPECGWPDGPAPASDEDYLEFWPDVDIAGAEDDRGNADRRADLIDSAGGRGPEFQLWDRDVCVPGTGDADCVRMGPETGGEVVDGYGFGADDDITGLVIIAEYGVGRVFDEPNFELSDPIGAVNLAGLVNSVSYDLSDLQKTSSKPKGQKGKPTETITEQSRVWAHINMPIDVIRHLIQYDACTGTQASDGYCDGSDLWRIDGGPIEEPPLIFTRGDAASIYLLEESTFTLKVFLVSGIAPNRLFDEDGDGDVDSADASAAGYTLLSNEDSISLLQVSQSICFGGGGGVIAWDLDSNGELIAPIVCPAGPGDLGRPPR